MQENAWARLRESRAHARTRVTQPSPRIFLHICSACKKETRASLGGEGKHKLVLGMDGAGVYERPSVRQLTYDDGLFSDRAWLISWSATPHVGPNFFNFQCNNTIPTFRGASGFDEVVILLGGYGKLPRRKCWNGPNQPQWPIIPFGFLC